MKKRIKNDGKLDKNGHACIFSFLFIVYSMIIRDYEFNQFSISWYS